MASRHILSRILLLFCLCAPAVSPLAAEEASDRVGIARGARVQVEIDALMGDSSLGEARYRPFLDRLFTRREAALAEELAATLQQRAFVAPVQPAAHGDGAIATDSFVVRVNTTIHFALEEKSPWATFLAGLSCFTLGGVDVFRYQARALSRVAVIYVSPSGQWITLENRRYDHSLSLDSDFFSASSTAREAQWVEELTEAIQRELHQSVASELPSRILTRARQLSAEDLSEPLRFPPALQHLDDPLLRETRPALSGELRGLVQRAARSVFQVLTPTGSGSGFVLSSRGVLLTSLHNLGGRKDAQIRFAEGQRLEARLFFADPDLDLAVLVTTENGLPALEPGDSDALAIGDTVIALGFPAGEGLTYSRGKISALANYRGTPILLSDSRTAAGSSGGPLLDRKGKVVGINFRRLEGDSRDTTVSLPLELIRKSLGSLLPVDAP